MNKITIVVPCYNSSKYVRECLDSIKQQSYENIEVFVIDNESTDNTFSIISEYRDIFNICSVPNIFHRCWDEAKNYGFDNGTGDYFTIVASDDLIHSDYIKRCVKYIENSKPLIFHSTIKGFDNNMQITNIARYNYSNISELKSELLRHCCVNSPSVFYSRNIYNLGLTKSDPATYSGAADYDLYCNIVHNNFYIENVEDWLGYYYRWHEEQATWEMVKDPTKYDKLIQEKWRDKWKL